MDGALSLAYLAETTIIFNLAYSELKRGRYFANAKEFIGGIQARLVASDNGHGSPAIHRTTEREIGNVLARLADLEKGDISLRLGAWRSLNRKGGSTCHFFSAIVYRFFERGYDRHSCWWLIALSCLILSAITYDAHNSVLPPWAWTKTYSLLVLCLLWPGVMVWSGRRMKRDLERIAIAYDAIVHRLVKTQVEAIAEKLRRQD